MDVYICNIGISFNFHTKDFQTYLAGSDDGYIYQCSYSHNDQHLYAIKGHSGPVTKIRSSPFVPGIILTSSADWTVKLWQISTTSDSKSRNAEDMRSNSMSNGISLISEFHSMNLFDSVHDIMWSSSCSTMFALVTGDGRIEVWDLSQSFIDPIYIDFGTDKGENLERLSVLFGSPCGFYDNASNSTNVSVDIYDEYQLMVTGTNDGVIEIFEIPNPKYQTHRLLKDNLGSFSKHQNQVEKLQKVIFNKISEIDNS